MQQKDHELHQF